MCLAFLPLGVALCYDLFTAESLVLNTHLLRALISLPMHSPTPTGQQQQQQQGQTQVQQSLKNWLLTWLQLLSTSSLATAAAAGAAVTASAAQQDLPVVLLALLPGGGRQQAAAGSTSCVAVGVDAWLPMVVQAAAEVHEDDEEGQGRHSSQDDAQSEGKLCKCSELGSCGRKACA
jgi:hypothetical protein